MKKLINAWGGDGCLSSAALFILACMGMLRNLPESDEILIRVLELQGSAQDDRMEKLKTLYETYYPVLFGHAPELQWDSITLNSLVGYHAERQHTLRNKIACHDYLFLGCSEESMDLDMDMTKSIYGKPYLGEIFYEDAAFAPLYESISDQDEEIVVINCGSYCGDGTASVFMPKESHYCISKKLHVDRYSVISGPAVVYSEKIMLPHQIYSHVIEPVDIFAVEHLFSIIKKESYAPENAAKHQMNCNYLNQKYQQICRGNQNMNPRYDADRFLNSLYTDNSRFCAAFVNLSTDDGIRLLPDEFSDRFIPESEKYSRHLHMIHLLNALSVREILYRYDQYQDGKIYAFGTSAGNRYQPSTIFDQYCEKSFWSFLLTAVFIRFSVSFFISYQGKKDITDKWALPKVPETGLFGLKNNSALKENQKAEQRDAKFAHQVADHLQDLLKNYICPVISMCREIHYHSGRTCLFTGNTEITAEYILQNEETILSLSPLISNILQEVPQYITNLSADALIREYQKNFPDFVHQRDLPNASDAYFRKIVRYAREYAEHLLN